MQSNMHCLEKKVTGILMDDVRAREDDKYLITLVYEQLGVNIKESFDKILQDNHLPSFESITRVRRKVQEKYPWLATERGKQKREEQEEKILDYVRCTNCGEEVEEDYISTEDRFINSGEHICLDCIENGYGG